MHSVHQSASQAPESHRPPIVRRIMSVASGVVSLGLIPVLWAVYRDDYLEAPVTIFIGLLVVAFGAGAVALWYPKSQRVPWRTIMLWVFALVIVGAGAIFFLAAD